MFRFWYITCVLVEPYSLSTEVLKSLNICDLGAFGLFNLLYVDKVFFEFLNLTYSNVCCVLPAYYLNPLACVQIIEGTDVFEYLKLCDLKT
jgi:hypothetical protein